MVAAPLMLRSGDKTRLESMTRSSAMRAGTVQRVRIVLLASQGVANAEIRPARRCGASDGHRLA